MNDTTRRAGKPRRNNKRSDTTTPPPAVPPIAAPIAARPAPEQVASSEKKLLASVPISVRWRDLDAFNHVNNSTFLTYLEEARLLWLTQIRGPWHGKNFTPVLAATEVNYRLPINWPGHVLVELYCTRLGRSSLTLSHRIVDAQQRDRLYSDGKVVMVWVEPVSGTAIELPSAVRNACEQAPRG